MSALGVIPLDIFNLDVAVFDTDEARVEAVKAEGCVDVAPWDAAALASMHMDCDPQGGPRFSMVIKAGASQATMAHECVHVADHVMDRLGIPTDAENTEVRAYLVGHLFGCLLEIMEPDE